MSINFSLSQLGWRPFFQQQLTLDEWEQVMPARVMAVHRSVISLATEQGELSISIHHKMPEFAVGDWVLLDENTAFLRLLDRLTLFSRKAAGSKLTTQLIAANVDTLFIASSMNDDFNLSRLERYIAIANDAGAEPVIVLTKADSCPDPDLFTEQAQTLNAFMPVIAVNALEPNSVRSLEIWCKPGNTIALLGSSGVGKSTLTNTLMGNAHQYTQEVREDDSKGKHTTTGRSLHVLPAGALLLDTPGMRELQLSDCEKGVEETFADIVGLSEHCRFGDCQHSSEPGCAIVIAIESGELDQRRFSNYQKLLKEQAINGEKLAEKRAREKDFTRYIKNVAGISRNMKKSL